MLRVECEKCKTPFQVDERRVPTTGLPMRCPKCGHNFIVEGPKVAAARLRRAGTNTLIFGNLDDILRGTSSPPPQTAIESSPPPPPPQAPPAPPPPPAIEPVHAPMRKRANTMPYAGVRKRPESDEPVLEVKEESGTEEDLLEELDWELASEAAVESLGESGTAKEAEAKEEEVVEAKVVETEAVEEPKAKAVEEPKAKEEEAVEAKVVEAEVVEEPKAKEKEVVEAKVVEEPKAKEKEVVEAKVVEAEVVEAEVVEEPKAKEEEVVEAKVVEESESESAHEHVDEPEPVKKPEPEPVKKPEPELEPVKKPAPEPAKKPELVKKPAPESAKKPEPAKKPAPAPVRVEKRVAEAREPEDRSVPGQDVSRESEPARKRPRSAAWVVGLVALAGAALEMTPYGAFGRVVLSDKMHAEEYAKLLTDVSEKTRTKMAADVYPDSVAALENLARTQEQSPRAKGVAHYRAIADAEAQLRFASTADVEKAKSLATSADDGSEDALVLRGELALRSKDASAAMEDFTRALAKRRSARAHFGLARAHALASNFIESKNAIEAALAASPRHVGARVLRANLTWERERNESAVAEDLAAILEGPAKEAASVRELASAWALRALTESAQGKAQDAHAAIEQALKLDPSNIDALVARGEIAYAEGHHAEALASFEKALAAEVTPAAIAGAAKAKLLLDRISEAKAQLAEASKNYPKDVRIAYWLAKSDEALGNHEGAEREYLRAIADAAGAGNARARTNDAALPYAGLTRLLALQGRGKDAEAKLEEARAKVADVAPVERGLAEGYWQRALEQRKAGTTAGAIVNLKRALELDATRPEIYADLAESYEQRNDSQNAFLTWQKALKGNETQPYWKYRYGRLLLDRGTVGEASKHLVFAIDEANKMDPAPAWFVPAQLACAQALQKAGKFADAVEHYRRFLDLSPKAAPDRKDAIAALMELGASVK